MVDIVAVTMPRQRCLGRDVKPVDLPFQKSQGAVPGKRVARKHENTPGQLVEPAGRHVAMCESRRDAEIRQFRVIERPTAWQAGLKPLDLIVRHRSSSG